MAIELSGFRARYFKSFIDTGMIEIKPITLFFGHNSSGKSAVLSILPMLQQTINDPNRQTPFVFSKEAGVDLGAYDEVIYRHKVSLNQPIWFDLQISLVPTKSDARPVMRYFAERTIDEFKKQTPEFKALQIEIAASYNKKQRRISITDYKFTFDYKKTIFRIYRLGTAVNQKWHFEPDILENKDTKIFWEHFLPIFLEEDYSDDPSALGNLSSMVATVIHEEIEDLVHIGPLRDFPRRAYRLTGESPKDVGRNGENWLNILLSAEKREELIENVNRWLKRLGYSLKIDWGKHGYVHPMLIDKNGLNVSLKDIGFGISQILPVLIQGFSSKPGTILILEQPEIHLHPHAQAELGDILIAISQRGVRLLIETHSEHLLLRLQRRIAENYQKQNEIKPDDLSFYFVEHLENQSKIHEVTISETGEFIDPPSQLKTFFADDYIETLEWTKNIAHIKKGLANEHSD